LVEEELQMATTKPQAKKALLTKREVCTIVNATFPTIWKWMKVGKFPRSLAVSGRSMWRADEIDAWLTGLPIRPLKGDNPQHDAAA
jgi:predicted DNA-binding transcriptional regulator AlpA